MNRKELVQRVLARPEGPTNVDAVVDAVFAEISEALASGEEVKLRDFGTLYVSARQQTSRHPKTGTSFNGPMLMARFRPAERLRLMLKQRSRGMIASTESN